LPVAGEVPQIDEPFGIGPTLANGIGCEPAVGVWAEGQGWAMD